jgi:hypothetical protein
MGDDSGQPKPEELQSIRPGAYQLASAIRREAVGWFAKGAVVSIGTLAVAGIGLYLSKWLPEIAHGVPGGAIVAFERNDCPTGWRPYVGAVSRVIIGSGKLDKDQKYSRDSHGQVLEEHTSAEIGGDEARLILLGAVATPSITTDPPPSSSERLLGVEGAQGEHQTSFPPYIALNYCQKDYQD